MAISFAQGGAFCPLSNYEKFQVKTPNVFSRAPAHAGGSIIVLFAFAMQL